MTAQQDARNPWRATPPDSRHVLMWRDAHDDYKILERTGRDEWEARTGPGGKTYTRARLDEQHIRGGWWFTEIDLPEPPPSDWEDEETP